AIYSETERDSLHVRLADECWPVRSELRYGDLEEVLAIAQQSGADAIHPGYGFLAERADFAQACADAGVVFIGPKPAIIAQLQNKIDSLERVAGAGYRVPNHSEVALLPDDGELLDAMGADMGYPLVVKSCSGGRGRGERVISSPAHLNEMVAQARREALKIYGNERIYLERAIYPAHQIAVQILADAHGNRVRSGRARGFAADEQSEADRGIAGALPL
ncbi:MAG: ATP-grasp domain-containing protein, partial [Caldilineaceae bacterium]|nr:ATP-grasp domain-containing protein [Caldilineaceae bacterium]